MKSFKNTSENWEFFLSKVMSKSPKRWGIYSPKRKLAVRLICQPDRLTVDRPVDRQQSNFRPLELTVDRPVPESIALWSGQPHGRPPRYREQSSLVRSTGPLGCQTCTALCTSVDRSVDRPLVRSTVRSTDLACQPQSGSETGSEK